MKPAARKVYKDYGIAIVAAVSIALFIRFFVLEAYRIPTPAMRPTLEPGDTIFVSKAPLGFDREKIQRGDVLIFSNPSEPGRDYVKRVLGVAGDTVQVIKGRVQLNGQPVSVLTDRKDAPCGRESVDDRIYEVCWEPPLNEDFALEKVPPGSIFLFGDLRTLSAYDAHKRRSWGIFPVASVKGRARWIWLSIEPHAPGVSPVRFPNFRFERMFRSIQ